MEEFLTSDPINLNEEEMREIGRRREMDEKRVEEQKRFNEIVRQRAKELDVYMEKLRRDIVESSMLILEIADYPHESVFQTASQSSSKRLGTKRE